MKKVVVFGGGTGLSSLLKGLKLFPLDITAIVSVADDGRSTGKLREEFNIPAVGDLRNVAIALSKEPTLEKLFQYRFKTNGSFNEHSVGNILLAALFNINGNLKGAVESFSKILDLKGKVLPLTEDTVTLVAHTKNNEKIVGEANITKAFKPIKKIEYLKKPKILKEVIEEINQADAIIFSMGSLYTSILPHILCEEVVLNIKNSKAKTIYICNAMTEHGETDNFKASDHIKLLNKYAKTKLFDVIIVNKNQISKEIQERYEKLEKSKIVEIDYKELKKENIEIIEENLSIIENEMVRHDPLETGFAIFSYLMKRE